MFSTDFNITYDGVCLYAVTRVKASLSGKAILTFLNLAILAIIVLFATEKILVAALFFSLVEIFMIRYTLWNLYGEERLVLNSRSLKFQHHYGFFASPYQLINLNRRVSLGTFHTATNKDKKYTRFLIESYDEHDFLHVIYQSALYIEWRDFEILVQKINQLYVEEVAASLEMQPFNLN